LIVVDGAEIGTYVGSRLGVTIYPPFQAIGFLTDDKRPLAAFVFNEFNHSNIEMTIVAEPGGITRQILRYVAHYVFVKNKCRRLTVRTRKRNKKILQLAPRYGFKYECIAKQFFPDDDAVVFRMLKEDCRFL
jgi:RimJ/RimL family protein N-acetyltransferase